MAESMRRECAVERLMPQVPPEIVTVPGVPEIFADVALLELFDGMARVKLGRRDAPHARSYEQCGLLLMPARSFTASHYLTRRLLEHAEIALDRGH